MAVLDSFAVLALLKDEPAAERVGQLFRTKPRPALTALGVAEVLDHLVRHYHRRDRPISLVDCVAAEVARHTGAPLATSDPHLLDTCEAERIAWLALPDARGVTWEPPS